MIYLDWAATTPPDINILQRALMDSSEFFANPSSPHRAGKAAKKLLDDARSSFLATLISSFGIKKQASGIAFTASGTEADQIPLLALLRNSMKGNSPASSNQSRPHLVISAIEHAAIYSQAEALGHLGFDLSVVKPDSNGIVQPEKVAEALRPTTKLVAIMAVNNETGAVQDIRAIGASIDSASRSLGIRAPLFHVDCVQALGKILLDLSGGNVTSAAFSRTKFKVQRELEPSGMPNPSKPSQWVVGRKAACDQARKTHLVSQPSLPAPPRPFLQSTRVWSTPDSLKRRSWMVLLPFPDHASYPLDAQRTILAGVHGSFLPPSLGWAAKSLPAPFRMQASPCLQAQPVRARMLRRAVEFSMSWDCPRSSPSRPSAFLLVQALAQKISSNSFQPRKTCIAGLKPDTTASPWNPFSSSSREKFS